MTRISTPRSKQVGGEAVAQRMQRHRLGDPGGRSGLMEEAVELAGRHRPIRARAPGTANVRSGGLPPVVARRAKLPPLPAAEPSSSFDNMTWRSLRPLACTMRMTFCALSMSPTLSLHHLAGAQAAAIGETEQHADLEGLGDREQALGLVRAQHQRDLLRLANVVDLSGEGRPPGASPGTGT